MTVSLNVQCLPWTLPLSPCVQWDSVTLEGAEKCGVLEWLRSVLKIYDFDEQSEGGIHRYWSLASGPSRFASLHSPDGNARIVSKPAFASHIPRYSL